MSSNFFLGVVAHHSSFFFDAERRYPIAKYTGRRKFCDFRLKSPFIWETRRDKSI